MKRSTSGARAPRKNPSKSEGAVTFTHVEKVLFPEEGITKEDVLSFYQAVAPHLLPHVKDRPATLERLPDGLVEGGPRFWQKTTPAYYPQWIPRIALPAGRGKTVNYVLVNDVPSLLYLVNQGTLTFHVWLSRVQSLDVPDYVLFDLDRSKAMFSDVVQIARHLHKLLDAEGVESYPKTSGKSGLHVLVPWKQNGGYDAGRAWAMQIADHLVRDLPDIATTERLKNERHGHVYVDVIQNARGHHVVPPYVLRATPGATVSTPLDWDEVNSRLNPAKFTMKAILNRVSKQKRDPMAGLLASETARPRSGRRA